MKILVVEDDRNVAEALQFLLSSYHYAVDVAEDGSTALQMLNTFEYDLLLLDILLPDLNGITLCQRLRAEGMQMPILLLTGQGKDGGKTAIALNAGADDYVVKPFDAEELVARVQALLRRGGPKTGPILTWGKLSVDPSGRKVTYGTRNITLTPKEYGILELLLRNPQKVFGARMILDQVWSSMDAPNEESVRFHIKELRKKLTKGGAPSDLVKTVYRTGYQLNPMYAKASSRQMGDELTTSQIAELKSVNEALRAAVEALRSRQTELNQRNQELENAQQSILTEQEQLQVVNDQLSRRVDRRTARLTRAYRQLQQRQRQWQTLFDQALIAIALMDDEGCFRDVNTATCHLLGVAREAIVGADLMDFVEPTLDLEALWQQFLQQGEMVQDCCLHRPDGEMRKVQLKAIAQFTPGRHLLMMREIAHGC